MNTVHTNIRELDTIEVEQITGGAYPPSLYGYNPGAPKLPPPPKPPGYTS